MCIDNGGYEDITIGKWYDVLYSGFICCESPTNPIINTSVNNNVSKKLYYIYNDYGIIESYKDYLFKAQKEIRKEKLIKLKNL